MPNQEKKVMSAPTLHKRPPKLHLGHDDRVHSATTSDTIENLSDMNSCNAALTTMSSLPSTPTTPSTPNSPAISKPPKKRYLENGSFRSNEDHATPQMAKLMELAKVCSSTSKSIGSLSEDFPPDINRDPMDDKQLGQKTDLQANINYSHSKYQASGDGVSFSVKMDSSTHISTYNQIPTFDVDIAGRIRDSDLFKTSSSSLSATTTVTTTTTATRSEEPLNLCTDKKTITTCQQDLISRMVDKFFCDPAESKGTLLDSFLLKMNSHKRLCQDEVVKATNNKTKGENGSDGEEVECVGRFKGIKFHSNDRIGTPKVALGNAMDDNGAVTHCRGEKRDNFEGTENRVFLQKQSQNSTVSTTNTTAMQSIASKTVANSEKTTHCGSGSDFVMEAITPLKEGQRKSPRSSKGKRYKAFLTEGFLQPSKDSRKQLQRNNSEEQIDCDKYGKEADLKPNKPNKKRKALDEKGNTKERLDDKARENKGNCFQQTDVDGDVHRLRKTKRKNVSITEVQESEKSIDENEQKPDYQYCCIRNASDAGNCFESQDISDDVASKPAALCDTQKSQTDENQKKRPIELCNLNDDSDSPPKLTRMDEDNGLEGEV